MSAGSRLIGADQRCVNTLVFILSRPPALALPSLARIPHILAVGRSSSRSLCQAAHPRCVTCIEVTGYNDRSLLANANTRLCSGDKQPNYRVGCCGRACELVAASFTNHGYQSAMNNSCAEQLVYVYAAVCC